MKAFIRLQLFALAVVALAAPAPRLAYESQVVVLVVTTQDYDPWKPWEKKTDRKSVV